MEQVISGEVYSCLAGEIHRLLCKAKLHAVFAMSRHWVLLTETVLLNNRYNMNVHYSSRSILSANPLVITGCAHFDFAVWRKEVMQIS